MKKIMITIIAALVICFAFTGCGRNGGEGRTDYDIHLSDMQIKLLYDFDYMMQMMEYTFPFFGVAERRFGVDIRELAAETRDFIAGYPDSVREAAEAMGISFEDLPRLDEQVFWWIVQRSFFGRIPRAFHLDMFDVHTIDFMAALIDPNFFLYHDKNAPEGRSPITRQDLNYIRHQPATRLFYDKQADFWAEHSHILENLFWHQRLILGCFAHFGRAISITTEILEQGKIAYVRIPSFGVSIGRYLGGLMEFYKEVQNYGHLIIDIRCNLGEGLNAAFYLTLHPLRQHTEHPEPMPLYVFFSESELGEHIAEFLGLLPTSNFAPYMPELNRTDAQGLGHGVRMYADLFGAVSPDLRRQVPHVPFNGQIWLLVCESKGSSAAALARYAKHTDFAILVGEQIGGVDSLGQFFTALPNTGIVVQWDVGYMTDVNGRAFEEYSTAPHYFNREGLDALETVLQLIAERH